VVDGWFEWLAQRLWLVVGAVVVVGGWRSGCGWWLAQWLWLVVGAVVGGWWLVQWLWLVVVIAVLKCCSGDCGGGMVAAVMKAVIVGTVMCRPWL
jgi:hypothetical protein